MNGPITHLVRVLTAMGAAQTLVAARACAADAGSVSFLDDKNDRVVISRNIDEVTGALTNTITTTRRDGTTETRTISTIQTADGGYDVTRFTVNYDGRSQKSMSHFGGAPDSEDSGFSAERRGRASRSRGGPGPAGRR